MKNRRIYCLLVLCVGLFLLSCVIQEDTCEEDRNKGNWDQIIGSNSCSAEQKGEAYLAKGEFDYFRFAQLEDPELYTFLNLTAENWEEERYNYYRAAANIVRDRYETGNDTAKTIFFLGSFLALYTYLGGNLDNGKPEGTDAAAWDGNIESSEVDEFTGAGIQTDSTGDGTDLDASTDSYQFEYNGIYYILEETTQEIFVDLLADGIKDGDGISAFDAEVLIENKSNWTVLNQIVHVVDLNDPLATSGGAEKATLVTSFSASLVNYLSDVEKAMLSLGMDSSSDSIATIVKYRNKLDNGGVCDRFKNNPNLPLVEIFVGNSQKEEIVAGGTFPYANVNLLSPTELGNLGEDSSGDFQSIPDVSAELKIRLLFSDGLGNYIHNWGSAKLEIQTAMLSMAQFQSTGVESGDGKIAFSEIVCAAELLSSQ